MAFLFGAIANRLRIAPIVGYLLAGIVIGPFTPGFVANQALAQELAEIGVVLLMFGVGLHFSIGDLLSVRRIAIPGALVQIVIATVLGWLLAKGLGWPIGAGLIFGLSLSTASTVVLLRVLEDRHLLDTKEGHIAVGWLVVEDIAMVIALVVVPLLSSSLNRLEASPQVGTLLTAVGLMLAKIGLFIALMLVVGKRLIPWTLARVSRTGSRELFTLATLSIALGIAFGSAALFDVSFALGAFFAGLILNESELSHKAASDTLPLRDAFAVLFFVAVGMLFDPGVLVRQPWVVVGTLLIIMIGKSLAAWLIVLAFGYPQRVALIVSASLAQIAEFAFMLADLGVKLELLMPEGRDLVLAGSIFSIVLNRVWFVALDSLHVSRAQSDNLAPPVLMAKNHVILVGHGRVGSIVARALWDRKCPLVVIENNKNLIGQLRSDGIDTILGNVAEPAVLDSARVTDATFLISAIPNTFEAGVAIERARSLNPSIEIVARAHSEAEVEYLRQRGAHVVVMGEREIAKRMIEQALERGDV